MLLLKLSCERGSVLLLDLKNKPQVAIKRSGLSKMGKLISKRFLIKTFAVASVALLLGLVIDRAYFAYANSRWNVNDFTYQDTTITGLSDSGAEKIKTIKEVFLPDYNLTGQAITSIKDFTVLQDQNNPKAFMNKGLTMVKLPANLQVIGQEAFLNNQLTSIDFPDTTTIIGTSSFARNQLTSVAFPNDLTSINNSAFRDNKIQGTVVISNNVTEIGEAVFANNRIKKLILNNKVTRIDSEAFKNNSISIIELADNSSLQFPDSLHTIGAAAFSNNVLARKISLPAQITTLSDEVFSNNKIAELDGLNRVKKIGKKAFYDNDLRTVDLSEAIQIDQGAFESNNQLTGEYDLSKLSILGAGAFKDCSLSKVILPDNMSVIEEDVFYGNKLTHVKLPLNLVEIKDRAFANNLITSLTMPDSVNIIGAEAFFRNQIETLSLPNAIVEIRVSAFGENKIKKVNVPNSLLPDKLGLAAFSNKEHPIKTVYLNTEGFQNVNNHIHRGCSTFNYENTNEWCHVIDSVEINIKLYKQGTAEAIANDFKVIGHINKQLKLLDQGSYKLIKFRPKSEDYPQYLIRASDGKTYTLIDEPKQVLPDTQELIYYYKEVAATAWVAEDFVWDGTVIKGFSRQGLDKSNVVNHLTFPNNSANQAPTEIYSEAFLESKKGGIKTIFFRKEIKKIGKMAFKAPTGNLDQYKLTNIGFEAPCDATIYSEAFARNRINNLYLPDGLKFDGRDIFEDNLTQNVRFPAGIEVIPSGFLRRSFNESYEPKLTSIVIPESVKIVSSFAFDGNELASLIVPSGVRKINDFAFNKNRINRLQINSLDLTLGSRAFGDNKLTELSLPAGLKFSPDSEGTFANNLITNLDFGDDITEVPASAFARNRLTKLKTKQIKVIRESAFSGNLINDLEFTNPQGMRVHCYAFANNQLTELNLPNGIEYSDSHKYYSSCGGVFEENKVTSVTLPTDIKSIPQSFLEDNLLTEVNIPVNYERIGKNAFANNQIAKVDLTNSKIKNIDNDAFRNNKIVELKLNGGLEKIGAYAFEHNLLNSLIIPNTTKQINAGAFASNKLVSLDLPREGVKYINGSHFNNNLLTSVELPLDIKIIPEYFLSNNKLQSISIPAGVTAIERYAFADNQISGKLIMPDSIEAIGPWSFYRNSISSLGLDLPNIKKIGYVSFSHNKITNLKLPTKQVSYDDSVFDDNLIEELQIPESVVTIPQSMFSSNKIKKLVIPDTVKEIRDYAFMSNKIKDLKLGQGIVKIGSSAFSGNGISQLDLPSSVTTIGGSAFEGNKIQSVAFPDGVTNIGYWAFKNNLLTKIELPNSLTELRHEVFKGNKLTGVLIPESVTNIANNAFENNTGVPSVGNRVLLFTSKDNHGYHNSNWHVINANNIKIKYVDQLGALVKTRVLWRSEYKTDQFITISNGYVIKPEDNFSFNDRFYVLEDSQPVEVTVTDAINEVVFRYRGTQGYRVNYYLENTTNAVPGINPSSRLFEKVPGVYDLEFPVVSGYDPVPGQPQTVQVLLGRLSEVNIYYRQSVPYTISYFIKDTTSPVPGINPAVVTSTGVPGSQITVNYPTATNHYHPVGGQIQNFTLNLDPTQNNHVIYYEQAAIPSLPPSESPLQPNEQPNTVPVEYGVVLPPNSGFQIKASKIVLIALSFGFSLVCLVLAKKFKIR